MAERIECEICFEKCLNNELKEHQEMCFARFIFQCAICNGYYVSKEGLWNHLDLHEILDESKELHYQEVKTTFKLHQCTLCNDQRGYQENLYWKHVHEEHDGLYLWCSLCRESFRSQKLKADHDLTHCKDREQTVASGLEVNQKFSRLVFPMQVEKKASLISCGEISEEAADHLESSQGELSTVPGEEGKCPEINEAVKQDPLVLVKIKKDAGIDSRVNIFSPVKSNVADDTDNNMTKKDFAYLQSRSETNVDFDKTLQQLVENSTSGASDINKNLSCELCGQKFKTLASINEHIEHAHHIEKDLSNIEIDLMSHKNQQEKKQAEQFSIKMEITVEETTILQHDDFGILMPNLSTITDSSQYSKEQESINSDPPSVGFSTQISALIPERNLYLLEEFACTSSDPNNVDSREHLYADSNVADNKDNNMAEKKSEMMAEGNNVQPPVENSSNGTSEAKRSFCNELDQESQSSDDVNLLQGENMELIMGIKVEETTLQEQTNHMSLRQDENMELKMEIKVEETTLQEQEYQAPDEDRVKSPAITIISASRHEIHKTNHKHKFRQESTHRKIPERNTVCQLCSETFRKVCYLNRHVRNAHPPSEVPCSKCDLMFSTRPKLTHHMRTVHTEPIFKCSHCPKMFHEKHKLKQHESTHNKTLERNVVCKLCPRTFQDEFGLHQHVYNSHPPSELPCGMCDLKFSNINKRTYHMRKTHTEPKLKCSHCPKMCHMKIDLIQHELTHKTLERNEICKLCPKTFRGVYNLQRHVRSTHPPSELPCGMCDLKFTTRPKLIRHKRTAHTEPTFKCSHCPKIFHWKIDLKNHESTHNKTQDRNIVCKLCPKTFRDEFGLHRHVYFTHPPSELECALCDLKFTTRSKLDLHMKTIHKSRSKCPECDKPFLTKSALRKHMDFHSKAIEKQKRSDDFKRRRLEAKGENPPSDDSTGRRLKEKRKMPTSERRRSNRIRAKE